MRYSMLIQWSDEDQAYLVSLPEWNPLPLTHGDTYEEAVRRGHEVLEMLVESRREHGEPLPAPRIYASAS
ncbi:MAG: type II toxin-antitoxin system HicB family antitoxin [Ktedonobacterales bacterium]